MNFFLEYLLAMDYVEESTLRDYLEENFYSLDWQDKYGLAIQLSSAIQYLHEKGIVMHDLNSNNVFVQQHSVKLADSGLSKSNRNIDQNSFDIIPYIDPQVLSSSEGPNEKSYVYSVGVLLWELSSGKRPFSDKKYVSSLDEKIAQGLRESIINGTPKGYSDLYTSK
jgi:serine/threonine protein kinase